MYWTKYLVSSTEIRISNTRSICPTLTPSKRDASLMRLSTLWHYAWANYFSRWKINTFSGQGGQSKWTHPDIKSATVECDSCVGVSGSEPHRETSEKAGNSPDPGIPDLMKYDKINSRTRSFAQQLNPGGSVVFGRRLPPVLGPGSVIFSRAWNRVIFYFFARSVFHPHGRIVVYLLLYRDNGRTLCHQLLYFFCWF